MISSIRSIYLNLTIFTKISSKTSNWNNRISLYCHILTIDSQNEGSLQLRWLCYLELNHKREKIKLLKISVIHFSLDMATYRNTQCFESTLQSSKLSQLTRSFSITSLYQSSIKRLHFQHPPAQKGFYNSKTSHSCINHAGKCAHSLYLKTSYTLHSFINFLSAFLIHCF